MSDGVIIPLTGSGDSTKTVATDDAGAAGHVQVVKLAISTDGSATAIPASASGLKVDLGVDNDITVASLPLPSGAATSAAQTDKSQFTKLTDGTDTALITASGEQNVLESNSAAIKTSVELIDNAISAAGFNITQFAGTNNASGSGTATGALRVELPTNGTGVIATVGAVTAITNALPAGNNNIGDVDVATLPVAFNTGTRSATTQRVTVATDDSVPTSEIAPTTVLNGNKNVTTAGTRVTLAASTACKSVTIKAKSANTGTIYVGDTTVAASNGFALAAGETVSLDIANLTTVNLDASVNGEGVTYVGIS